MGDAQSACRFPADAGGGGRGDARDDASNRRGAPPVNAAANRWITGGRPPDKSCNRREVGCRPRSRRMTGMAGIGGHARRAARRRLDIRPALAPHLRRRNQGKPPMNALDGVRVLDFTTTIAGPHCTRLLADLGAEVIKIESPEGDMMRARLPLRNGASTSFGQLNTGKKSLVLDLKRPEAVAVVHRLVKTADVRSK